MVTGLYKMTEIVTVRTRTVSEEVMRRLDDGDAASRSGQVYERVELLQLARTGDGEQAQR